MSTADDVVRLVEQYECGIAYTPLDSEVHPSTLLPDLSPKTIYSVEPDPSIDPIQEAFKVKEMVSGRSTFLLIPGQQFDASGTRHGRGAGWYDRFLSVAPKNWLRIGLCYDKQFSKETLVRESWDEPMDFVCVVTEGSPDIECYETHSRDHSDAAQ